MSVHPELIAYIPYASIPYIGTDQICCIQQTTQAHSANELIPYTLTIHIYPESLMSHIPASHIPELTGYATHSKLNKRLGGNLQPVALAPKSGVY